MRFVTDPTTAVKIQKMQKRSRLGSAKVQQRSIDQTHFAIADGRSDNPEFSFLVIGDSGAGSHRGHHPQRRIAEQMLLHGNDARFILHTGDVIYLVGSSEFYPANFIEPYREFLVGGEQYQSIAFDRMVFKLPFLPVLGNHDYYDLPLLYGALIQSTYPVRQLFKSKIQLNLGWHGSHQGRTFAQAFLDPLWLLDQKGLLEQHLDQHYTVETPTGRCLKYEPGQFTRLPNRYYRFRYGDVDFFGLDSNTFNQPVPLPLDPDGQQSRAVLMQQQLGLEQEQQQLLLQAESLDAEVREQSDQIDDIQARLQQTEEMQFDIDKQLAMNTKVVTDWQQLEWLRDRLIESWNSDARGRVIFFHHPPYVTEATKWYQGQTLAVRQRLREVFDQVAAVVGRPEGRGMVDLVLNGHAHCFEYLRTLETGHADSNINWIVCGGSGYSLRRQRSEGAELTEFIDGKDQLVAKSQLFVGRSGQGSTKRRPYSFARIDVQPGDPVQFVIRPYVSEWFMGQWHDRALPEFVV
jgi:3',5'-cyclic AMP phosphodiesterase CpdA